MNNEPKPRALLIEDLESKAAAMKRLLEKQGFDVVHVTNAQDAAPHLRAKAVDAVITDWSFPRWNDDPNIKKGAGEIILHWMEREELRVPKIVVSGDKPADDLDQNIKDIWFLAPDLDGIRAWIKSAWEAVLLFRSNAQQETKPDANG